MFPTVSQVLGLDALRRGNPVVVAGRRGLGPPGSKRWRDRDVGYVSTPGSGTSWSGHSPSHPSLWDSLRTWWRRAGRSLRLPANGISGPTQAPGRHTMRYAAGSRPLGNLAAGSYRLRVEAAREVGGRELVTIPFQWPPRRAQTTSSRRCSCFTC